MHIRSVWRAGEGKALIKGCPGFEAFIGQRVYLPDYLTYKWTLIVMALVFPAYFLSAQWNEETDPFTVETE